ncbi:prepilin-type N-terminal cleavage/methylation domain-containing protein [bacterium]|nr:prepilin-type N-terminal cleavage/methylation domain-containing protein [bacterium]
MARSAVGEVSRRDSIKSFVLGRYAQLTLCHPELVSGSKKQMLKPVQNDKNKKAAFTLAEVLITIGVIGVVAAMTMPTLIRGIAERSNSETQANVAQKITKSMDLMRADGKLERTYESTDAFVDELSKYLKITTRCNAANIDKCWPTSTVTTSDGKTFEVKKAKKGKNLQIKSNTTDNVGMILADGTSLIMTYNQDAALIGDGDTVSPSFATLPIGFGRTKKYAYTTSVTDPIDFVMDVNGFRGPNSETRDGKYNDIRSFKVAKFSEGCAGIEVDGIGCVYVLPSFSAIDTCSDKTYDSNGTSNSYCSNNRWAGAKKACSDIGMSLPGTGTLQAIYNKSKSDPSLGLPTSGYFWSSAEIIANYAYAVNLYNGYTNGSIKYYSGFGGLCIGD